MNLTITITVSEDPRVNVHTSARDISERQIRPMLDRARRALQAEIDALESCPYHLNAARSEGLQPVSVKGEDVQIRGGSGAQERPSRRAPTDCQTSGGGE